MLRLKPPAETMAIFPYTCRQLTFDWDEVILLSNFFCKKYAGVLVKFLEANKLMKNKNPRKLPYSYYSYNSIRSGGYYCMNRINNSLLKSCALNLFSLFFSCFRISSYLSFLLPLSTPISHSFSLFSPLSLITSAPFRPSLAHCSISSLACAWEERFYWTKRAAKLSVFDQLENLLLPFDQHAKTQYFVNFLFWKGEVVCELEVCLQQSYTLDCSLYVSPKTLVCSISVSNSWRSMRYQKVIETI